MRFPKPFFRSSKSAWYLQLGKRQIALGKNRDEAFDRYREILLHEKGPDSQPTSQNLSVAEVSDLFLEWSERHNEPGTYRWYRDFLQSFSDLHGTVEAAKLKPFHVTRWLDKHSGWGEASRRCATIAVKRAFNWADAEGVLSPNPIKHVKKGPSKRRERILTTEERQQILNAARGQAFRDFLQALQETGCRPSEIAHVTASDVDQKAGLWILAEHKTKKRTGKPRIVYLTPPILELTKRHYLQVTDDHFQKAVQQPAARFRTKPQHSPQAVEVCGVVRDVAIPCENVQSDGYPQGDLNILKKHRQKARFMPKAAQKAAHRWTPTPGWPALSKHGRPCRKQPRR